MPRTSDSLAGLRSFINARLRELDAERKRLEHAIRELAKSAASRGLEMTVRKDVPKGPDAQQSPRPNPGKKAGKEEQ